MGQKGMLLQAGETWGIDGVAGEGEQDWPSEGVLLEVAGEEEQVLLEVELGDNLLLMEEKGSLQSNGDFSGKETNSLLHGITNSMEEVEEEVEEEGEEDTSLQTNGSENLGNRRDSVVLGSSNCEEGKLKLGAKSADIKNGNILIGHFVEVGSQQDQFLKSNISEGVDRKEDSVEQELFSENSILNFSTNAVSEKEGRGAKFDESVDFVDVASLENMSGKASSGADLLEERGDEVVEVGGEVTGEKRLSGETGGGGGEVEGLGGVGGGGGGGGGTEGKGLESSQPKVVVGANQVSESQDRQDSSQEDDIVENQDIFKIKNKRMDAGRGIDDKQLHGKEGMGIPLEGRNNEQEKLDENQASKMHNDLNEPKSLRGKLMMNIGKKDQQERRQRGKTRRNGNMIIGWENVERERQKTDERKSNREVDFVDNRRMDIEEEKMKENLLSKSATEIETGLKEIDGQKLKISEKRPKVLKSKKLVSNSQNEIPTRTKSESSAYHERFPPPLLPFTLGDQLQGVLAILPSPRNSTRREDLPSYSSPTTTSSSSPPSPLEPSEGSDSECYLQTGCTASCGEGFRLLLPNLQGENCRDAVLQVTSVDHHQQILNIYVHLGHPLYRGRMSRRL